jgi:hypothetical protein
MKHATADGVAEKPSRMRQRRRVLSMSTFAAADDTGRALARRRFGKAHAVQFKAAEINVDARLVAVGKKLTLGVDFTCVFTDKRQIFSACNVRRNANDFPERSNVSKRENVEFSNARRRF